MGAASSAMRTRAISNFDSPVGAEEEAADSREDTKADQAAARARAAPPEEEEEGATFDMAGVMVGVDASAPMATHT